MLFSNIVPVFAYFAEEASDSCERPELRRNDSIDYKARSNKIYSTIQYLVMRHYHMTSHYENDLILSLTLYLFNVYILVYRI